MSSELNGSMVFDTSVLVELSVDSPISKAIQVSISNGQIQALTGELNLTELEYILCRSTGSERSKRSIELLRRANQIEIVPSSSFLDRAAEMKCSRSISLVDCVTISMGESLELPVLFARRESELKTELRKKAFRTRLLFMDSRA
ncbi:MAG: PIN domain-containing protein [Nitrososphaerales archaeon]